MWDFEGWIKLIGTLTFFLNGFIPMRTIQPVKVSSRGRGPCGCPDGLGQPGQEVSRIGVVTMTLAILMVCGPLSDQVVRTNCSVSAMSGSSGLLGPAAGLLGAVVPVASPV